MPHSPPRIAALGEVLWDMFPDGARFGGAPANFAHHAAALGAQVFLVTGLGKDELGRDAWQRLRQSGLELDEVNVTDRYPTGRVQVELNERGEASYRFGEDEAWDHLQWSDSLAELAHQCDAVCFGTLGQRSRESRAVIERFVTGTAEGCFRVLDLNLRPPFVEESVIETSLKMANVLKLNDSELRFLANHFSLSLEGEGDRIGELAERFDLRAVALSQGERGAILYRDGSLCEVESRPVTLADTVGAGDSFTAVMVMGLLAAAPLEQIGRAACRVAEYVCSQQGATPNLPDSLLPSFVPR